ncbi:MAG: ADP-ribosylglycohydrolase family protein [Nanoarchaeota archaeon]|nr:ADP-ribosylglycohydrolase family protein [Nanoarchaeota archaeon]
MKEKYRAAMLGCALGDTLGMPVEVWPRERILKAVPGGKGIQEPIDGFYLKNSVGEIIKEDEFGKIKYWGAELKKGEWTDDTLLTLVVAESLIEGGLNLEVMARNHVRVYESARKPDGTIGGGFGGTTRQAIEKLIAGEKPENSGVIGGPGNAPGMKMAPLGMYMHATGKYREGLEFAQKVGKITHLDPRSLVSGVMQAHAIYSILQGADRKQFLNGAYEVCRDWEGQLTEEFTWHKSGKMIARIDWILDNKDSSVEEAFNYLGNSSAVYKSYPFALFMFQRNYDNPESAKEMLLDTVNYGGDCDTTAAIAGTLLGARHGMVFPTDWVNALSQRDCLLTAADNLYAFKEISGGRR